MKAAGVEGYIVVWMDDVLVASEDESSHQAALKILFQVSQEQQVRYKLDLTKLARSEVVWCGFRVSAQGRKVAASRADLQTWATPTTRSQIQQLTGWAQWSAQDHPRLHFLLQPFFVALAGGGPIPDLAQPMLELKQALGQEDDWLAFPQMGRRFDLFTDASLTGVGASVFQDGHAVAHISQALTVCQRRWPVRDRELYAVIWCLRKLRWLRGSPIKCYVDHSSLAEDEPPEVGITDNHYSELRWSKWTEELLLQDISFDWRPGSTHVGPDGMSRHAGAPPPCPDDCPHCVCAAAGLRKVTTWTALDNVLKSLRERLQS
jgi:hypothetical protein